MSRPRPYLVISLSDHVNRHVAHALWIVELARHLPARFEGSSNEAAPALAVSDSTVPAASTVPVDSPPEPR